MKQPWRIWVYKPQEFNRLHTSNQTKHNKIMCLFYWLYCITGVWFRRPRLLQLMNSAQETDSFFSNCVEDSRKQYLLPECWSRTLSEFAHHSAYIRQNAVITTIFFLHRLSTYQWFQITVCWQKYIIHENDVTWASWRLKLPVARLFVQKIFRLRWNKNKATHYWPFLRGVHQLLVDSLDSPHNPESVSISRRHHVQIHLYSVIMT